MAFKRVIIRRVGPLFWLLDPMRIRYAVLLALFALIAGLIAGFFAFSFYWRHYNSSLISQTYSDLELYAGGLSFCEKAPSQCNARIVTIFRIGYMESLVLATGIYVISQDASYKYSACQAIRKVKSGSPEITESQTDANKYLRCENGI